MVNNGKNNVWYMLSLITQLTITFLTPVFLMLALALWRQEKFGFGSRVVLLALLMGLGSGFISAWKVLKQFLN